MLSNSQWNMKWETCMRRARGIHNLLQRMLQVRASLFKHVNVVCILCSRSSAVRRREWNDRAIVKWEIVCCNCCFQCGSLVLWRLALTAIMSVRTLQLAPCTWTAAQAFAKSYQRLNAALQYLKLVFSICEQEERTMIGSAICADDHLKGRPCIRRQKSQRTVLEVHISDQQIFRFKSNFATSRNISWAALR